MHGWWTLDTCSGTKLPCETNSFHFAEKSRGNLDYAMFEEETPLHIDMRRFTYEELNIITNNFESNIGRGGFGIVYHGVLENGDDVVVKVLMETSISESIDFLPEVNMKPTRSH